MSQYLLLVVVALLVLATSALAPSSTSPSHLVVDISRVGFEKVEAAKAGLEKDGWARWIEVGDKLLALSDSVVPTFIVPDVHIHELEGLTNFTLLHNLGYAIVRTHEHLLLEELHRSDPARPRKFVQSFPLENLVLAVQGENIPQQNFPAHVGSPQAAPISTLVGQVSADRWFNDVKTLASYNRYTKGPDISYAQHWILSQLATLTNITVTTQPFTYGSTSGVNVIGTIPGTTSPDTWVIVGGHYDSISQSPSLAAPGAEDNGSGAAAVLEMARIFNAYRPPSTVLLIFYSGEEQGLFGSIAHSQSLVNSGDASKVKLMHNMDMIAYQTTPSAPHAVILETSTDFTTLFPYYRQSAQRYTTLATFESTFAFGSDHEPYLERGIPALLTIDKDWDSYPYYHRTTDTIDKLNPSLGFEIVKLGVGAVAQVLGYPF